MTVELLVTSGVGPVEVRRFVAALAEALSERLPVVSRTTAGPEDAPVSVVREVEGGDVGPWLGTHALVRRGERGHGRSRWFAAVTLLPPIPEPPPVDPRDVVLTSCRAGGPGGQGVNTTSSAVIARHLPTGLVVRVEDERSQHRNRARALERLAAALARRAEASADEVRRRRWLDRREVVRGGAARAWRDERSKLVEVG